MCVQSAAFHLCLTICISNTAILLTLLGSMSLSVWCSFLWSSKLIVTHLTLLLHYRRTLASSKSTLGHIPQDSQALPLRIKTFEIVTIHSARNLRHNYMSQGRSTKESLDILSKGRLSLDWNHKAEESLMHSQYDCPWQFQQDQELVIRQHHKGGKL